MRDVAPQYQQHDLGKRTSYRCVMNTSFNGVSVVIPCLNEEASIGQVVDAAWEGIRALKLSGEVIVVDNGCTDRSAEIAVAHGARVIAESERGYGAAIRKGFANAKYDILVQGDGDLTYDFTKIDDLIIPILNNEADMVVGNRMSNILPGSMPALHRYVGNPALSLLLRIMFHRNIVRDAHCGLRAISTRAYRSLHCVTTGMEFASEVIVRAIHCNLRMQERTIVYHARVGDSKLSSFRDGWRHLRFMWLHSPASALLVPGCIGWLLGLAVALPIAFGPVLVNGRGIDTHCMIMGGLLNTISLQFITLGLIAKAYAHVSGLRHDPVIQWLYNHLTFEKLIFCASPLVVVGLLVALTIVIRWIASGFGSLDQTNLLFFAMLCMINGIQLGAAGYVFSILILPRHVKPFTVETVDEVAQPAEYGTDAST